MLKELLLHIRYPYTAAVLAIIWLGSAILILEFPDLPLIQTLIANALVSLIIAYFGFHHK